MKTMKQRQLLVLMNDHKPEYLVVCSVTRYLTDRRSDCLVYEYIFECNTKVKLRVMELILIIAT